MPDYISRSVYFTATGYSADELREILDVIDSMTGPAAKERLLPDELSARMRPVYQGALNLRKVGRVQLLAVEPVQSLSDWFPHLPRVHPADNCSAKDFYLARHFQRPELTTILKMLDLAVVLGLIRPKLGQKLITSYQKVLTVRQLCDHRGVYPADREATPGEWNEWYQRQIAS